ncbi:MAG: hypothetical protein ACI8PZ_003521 [Myxococcota bacterium]|jgi:hypothetical protein
MRFTRRELISGLAALTVLPARAATADGKRLVVVFARGGWDPTYVLDPKWGIDGIEGPELDSAEADSLDREVLATFGSTTITTNARRRPRVTTFFERWGGRTLVVNGISTGSVAHDPCRLRLLTGTTDDASADVATLVGAELGSQRALGSIDLSGLSYTGTLSATAGRLGAQNQLKVLVDPTITFHAPPGSDRQYPLYLPEVDDEAALLDHLRARATVAREGWADAGANDAVFDDWLTSLDRAERFRAEGAELLEGVELGTTATLRQQVDVGVALLARGTCQAVTLKSPGDWDTHADNALQHGLYDKLFDGLDHLATSLEAEGLLEHTTVAVLSEMGRTPRRNGAFGKDHWAHTSALFFGADVVGGRTAGGTTESLESLPQDPDTGRLDDRGLVLRYDHLAAGLLELMGLDAAGLRPGIRPWRGFRA